MIFKKKRYIIIATIVVLILLPIWYVGTFEARLYRRAKASAEDASKIFLDNYEFFAEISAVGENYIDFCWMGISKNADGTLRIDGTFKKDHLGYKKGDSVNFDIFTKADLQVFEQVLAIDGVNSVGPNGASFFNVSPYQIRLYKTDMIDVEFQEYYPILSEGLAFYEEFLDDSWSIIITRNAQVGGGRKEVVDSRTK